MDERRRERFALFCNVHSENIISAPDVKSPYEVPLVLEEQKLNEKILKRLKLPFKKPNLTVWKKFIDGVYSKKAKTIKIAIVGKYFGTGNYQLRDSYAALFDALDHASWKVGLNLETKWIDAESVERNGGEMIGQPDGIIVPIGWGKRGAEGMIAAAGYARDKKIPYLGLCYGLQHAVISFARDVIGWQDADTEENNKATKHQVIHLMPAQKKYMDRRAYGGTMRLGSWDARVKKGTRAYEIYGKTDTSERHRHRYEFNDKFVKDFEKHGLVISARSVVENLCEIIELPKDRHPFYFGTQGHPEYKSQPTKPHPIFVAFLRSCVI